MSHRVGVTVWSGPSSRALTMMEAFAPALYAVVATATAVSGCWKCGCIFNVV